MAIEFKGFLTGTKAAYLTANVSGYPKHPAYATDTNEWGVVNAEGTGIVWTPGVKDVSYDGATAVLSFPMLNGDVKTITLPKENFLAAASFDADTHILTLTLVDDTEVDVDLADLVDTYSVDDTATVNMTLATDGTITADVNLSATVDNVLTAKADGLYVAPTVMPQIIELT